MSPEEIEKQKVPLTERMVREPFWLGLITVMVVMIVIGVGYLVKKHLPEKIEKLLRSECHGSVHRVCKVLRDECDEFLHLF